LHYGDLSDFGSISRIISDVKPDEIYNLGAQSHVKISFDMPDYTSEINGLGAMRILEAVRLNNLSKTRIYQAGTSEMFGNSIDQVITEKSIFAPISPYATSKVFAHHSLINYRRAYGMHATNGILFNHESPRRGENFVTRKITIGLAKIMNGESEPIYLGNLDAVRDWGHAKEYTLGMWKMLHLDEPTDMILATGKSYSVRDFLTMAFSIVGLKLQWSGEGINEKGFTSDSNKLVVEVDPSYYRPNELHALYGNSDYAKKLISWDPSITIEKLVEDMVSHDLKRYGGKNSF
jgi:GDPmannose 4,6-dehydratase